MPRPLRPFDDGLIYHVINRGNNRQPVFLHPDDFQAFLRVLGDLKRPMPFKFYGHCLMSNHFHLLLRPAGATVSRILQSLLVSHTLRYHKHYRAGGHIWQGRFKSPVIQNDEHKLAVLRYNEANPLRAKIMKRAEKYPWSSNPAHGLGVADEFVAPLTLYDQLSPLPKVRLRRWAEKVHQPPAEATLAQIRRSTAIGLPYGDQRWINRLAKKLNLDLTIRPRGRPRKQATSAR